MRVSSLPRVTVLAAACALTTLAGVAQAQTTAWADWTAVNGTAMSGRITLPDGAVRVKFSGPALYFSQIGEAGDRDYWISGSPDAYAATGRPTGADLLGFVGGTDTQKYKITFSRPVTNPVIALLSLGRNGAPARYVFTQTPTLLSSGVGYYGGCGTCLTVKKRTVTGTEGHGVVQFMGTFSSLSWSMPDYENWHGVQVGVPTTTAE